MNRLLNVFFEEEKIRRRHFYLCKSIAAFDEHCLLFDRFNNIKEKMEI